MNRLPGEQDGGKAKGWGHSVSLNTISSFFQNWGKCHLNSFGNGAKFRPSENTKKSSQLRPSKNLSQQNFSIIFRFCNFPLLFPY